MIVISDQDITTTEKLLLPEGKSFNEERRLFIRCMESRDVVACPGSGKTTALLAKLLILASKMPFEDGRGICVLTHTNVAIDEIKRKAGPLADNLFQHPNFFGTIQSFVNRFLAIPAYVSRFGVRQCQIDNELYAKEIQSAYYELGLQRNGAIYAQLQAQLKPLAWAHQDPIKIEFLVNLRYKFDGDVVHYMRGDKGRKVVSGAEKKESYHGIHSAKYGALENGFMRYQDAFDLALWYLSNHSQLSEAFSQRFAFVFVDEAQDTDVDQLAVLSTLFQDRKGTVVQCLGDPNQAIYSSSVQKDMCWQPNGSPPLVFSDSLRYGSTISKLLGTVRIDNSVSLKPNPDRNSLSPHMIIHAEGEEDCVLPAFGRLIADSALGVGAESKFKAIGWVGKDNREENKTCIPSYFASFEKTAATKRTSFENLLSYVCASCVNSENFSVSILYDLILKSVVHV